MKTKMLLFTSLLAITGLLISCGSTPSVTSPSQSTPVAATQSSPTNPTSNTSSGSVVEIKISGFAFDPKELTIKAGTEVKWTNLDNAPHNVTSDSGNELNSPPMNNGESWSHVFTQAGTYTYHCGVHPNMTATITVTP